MQNVLEGKKVVVVAAVVVVVVVVAVVAAAAPNRLLHILKQVVPSDCIM